MGTTTQRMQVAGIEFVLQDVPAVPREGEPDGKAMLDGPTVERMWLLVAGKLVELGVVGGESFRFLRKALKLRAVDLATLLDVSAETLSRWETGEREVPRAAWAATGAMVRDALGVPSGTADALRAAGDPPKRPKTVKLGKVA